MGVVDRLDRFQRKHRVVGYPIAVLYKFFDDQAGYLVSLMAYYAFLSIFPLLLLLSTLLGWVLQSKPEWREQIIDSAVQEIPVIGAQLGDPSTLQGSPFAIVVSSLVALYGGLGVGQAFQYAMNTVWGVPRNSRPNPFAARGRSFVLLLNVLLFVILTTGLTVIASTDVFGSAEWFRAIGGKRLILGIASFVITAVVFALAMRRAIARPVTLRQVMLGAIGSALTWQFLQVFGVRFVEGVIQGSSASNTVFGIVLGLLAFFYVTGLGIVMSAEADVVRSERLYPRALMTIFTDDVELTEGDRRAYARAARIGRFKGYQHIDVQFDPDPEPPEVGATHR